MRTDRVLVSSIALLAVVAASALADVPQPATAPFDHQYRAYAALLRTHVEGRGVNYRKLKANRSALDAALLDFGAIDKATEEGWTREQRLAFWINAYNVFTLRAVVDHYPIQGSWFSIYPRSSIRQIDGVWTRLKWRAAGADLTLDQIVHDILRPVFKQPLVHFALSCGSVSCPPLAAEAYVADRLPVQLDDAARRYLATEHGLRASGDRLDVSSLFNWYADDSWLNTRGWWPARAASRSARSSVSSCALAPRRRRPWRGRLPCGWIISSTTGR